MYYFVVPAQWSDAEEEKELLSLLREAEDYVVSKGFEKENFVKSRAFFPELDEKIEKQSRGIDLCLFFVVVKLYD